MAKKILATVSMIIGGAFIGFVMGGFLGYFLGKGADTIAREDFIQWRSLYGGIISAVAGLIVGAGTAGLGIRSRYGLEWVLIIGVGIPLGFWLESGEFALDIFVLIGIGVVASWLVIHFVLFALKKWLYRGPFNTWVIVTYVLIFGLVVFVAPLLLQLIASIFYF